MFHRRSRSWGNGGKASPPTTSTGTSGGTVSINSGPLRMWRRKHRRSASADDANDNAAAAASAASDQIKAETEYLMKLQKSQVQVGRLLGEGGFAKVFQVTVSSSNSDQQHHHQHHYHLSSPFHSKHKQKQKLALKQLRPELLKDKALFARAASSLVQEARIMEQLKGHANILQLRGVSCDAEEPVPTKKGFDSFFLVTDSLRETMTDRLRRWQDTPASSPKVAEQRWNYQLQYALQAAKALAYCHEQGIIFRDMKADNLGFSDEHTVVLYDFGMARSLPSVAEDFDDAQTCTSSLDEAYGEEEVFHMTICGTQRHMAPEVYNRGWYNLKADTYSWAMTVMELVTGKKPYPYMSLPVHKILVLEGGGRPNVDAFPVGLQAILKQAWAHNINERWSMEQVVAALETYIGSDCSQQQPPKEERSNNDIKAASTKLQDQARANNHTAVCQQEPTRSGSGPMLASAA